MYSCSTGVVTAVEALSFDCIVPGESKEEANLVSTYKKRVFFTTLSHIQRGSGEHSER
jgi:hypothetical protein